MKLKHEHVLVTGASGFLGKHVVEKLYQHGYENIITPSHMDYDLTNKASVQSMMSDFVPDIVIHLAAVVGGIGANQKRPADFFYQNLMMGANLIEEARKACTEKVVMIGTVCSYPKFCPVPFREESIWEGYPEETNAPYGIAKKALLVQAQAYRKQYGLNAIYLIPVNLYGPGDHFDPETSHVIPALIRKCVEAKERGWRSITCWGTGKASREFLYVEDAAEAIVMATEKYNGDLPVNIGYGMEVPISVLVQEITKLVGYTGKIEWDTTKPDGQPRRCLDTSRAKQFFGFTAKTDLRKGLRKTVDWYLKNKKGLAF